MKKNEVLKIIQELKLTEYQTEMLVRNVLDILNLNKDAENTYLNAQLNYYSNLLDYNVNAAELERVIGAPIKESEIEL